MRIAGIFLLFAGFALTVVALHLMPDLTRRAVFILCGLGVQFLGLGLLVRAHLEMRA
jgi:hypothetical protein